MPMRECKNIIIILGLKSVPKTERIASLSYFLNYFLKFGTFMSLLENKC